MWPNDFRNLYAKYARCHPEEFNNRVFWRTLYWHAIPFAWVIRLFSPEFFRLDWETIDRVAQTFDGREFSRDLDRYRFLNGQARSFLRSFLLVRISGKKLIRLHRRVGRALEARAELGGTHLSPIAAR